MVDPVAISDHVLEVTRQAITNRDFTMFSQRCILPQLVGTFEGESRLETLDDLRAMFERTGRYFETRGVIDLHRRTVAARMIAADRVQFTFVSQHIRAGFVLGPELVAHGTLRLLDGLWRIEDSRYATDDVSLSLALRGGVPPGG